MEVILETTEITLIPYVKMLLSSEGIKVFIFDQNMSTLEGSINVLPTRIMVASKDFKFAKAILSENGLISI